MTGSFRSKLLWVHTWTGITVGVVMLLFAVTGAILAIRHPLDDALYSHRTRSSVCDAPLPLESLVERAKSKVPGSDPESIDITGARGASIAVAFRNDDSVYLDPCNGRFLGVQNKYGGISGTMDWLHRFHFVENGRFIGGVFNIAILVLLVIVGLVLWWPNSRSALKSRLTYNRRLPGAARLLSLHRVTGIYAAALLVLLTVTAVPLSFDWAKTFIATVTASSVAAPPAPDSKSTGGPPVSMDHIRQQIAREIPTARSVSINFPKKENGSIKAEILEQDAPHINAQSYLYFDSVTGETLQRIDYASDIPLGRKIYLYTIALHAGLVGGLPYQLILMLSCLLVPVEFYSGVFAYFGKRQRPRPAGLSLRIVAREAQTPEISTFEFEEERGRPLPPFSAGAHIDLHLGGGMVRQYSLCNPPSETHRYVIAVQRSQDSRGGSRLIHDTFDVGQIVEASVPRNHFELAHEAPHSLLIAGGIGITPILCMAERLSSANAPFHLHYCFRARADAAFLDRIASSAFSKQVTLHESAKGGRLDIDALLACQDPDTHVYVCGPNSLNEAVIEAARAHSWPGGNVHREYFAAASHDRSMDKAFDVRIASSGELVHVPADLSVIEALAEHGIEIASSCNEGTCGTCLTRVLQGEIEHRDMLLTDEERRRNDQFTPCCSRARCGELVLDL